MQLLDIFFIIDLDYTFALDNCKVGVWHEHACFYFIFEASLGECLGVSKHKSTVTKSMDCSVYCFEILPELLFSYLLVPPM